tara:strand:- start:3549 stop:3974 length:426 start_codon:yes stop_codon:yes gene_type:complete
MAALHQVRDGIKTTLENNISGLRVYDVVPDYALNFPVAIVLPVNINFNIAMQRGTDQYTFDILVAVERGNSRTAQDKLDQYITGQGSSSLRQAIFNNRTLGLDNTDATITGVSNYAADVNLNGIDAIGANVSLEVYTKGTS